MRRRGAVPKPEDEEARCQRQAASQRSLEGGGLPLNAVDRLQEQAARQGTDRHCFTSDLSVNEWALVHQAGFEALGQVMGSSIYHVGWRGSLALNSGELNVLTDAHSQVRRLALGRMRQEAALLGATGVVGVRLESKEYEWGAELLEFTAIGTAIREREGASPSPGPPFLCNFSGEQFWLLREAGFRPVNLVIGNCMYYRQASTYNLKAGVMQNQELSEYTQSLYTARSLAMKRIQAEASGCGAAGIVEVKTEFETQPLSGASEPTTSIMYHFIAAGTAIAPHRRAAPFDITFSLPTR